MAYWIVYQGRSWDRAREGGYDAAFDAKLISFADDGAMILAEDFSVSDAQKAGINPGLTVDALTEKNRKYLAEHRLLLKAREKHLAIGNTT